LLMISGDTIQLTIPIEAIKSNMMQSFIKEFIQSMGSEFDASMLGQSVTYDAVVDGVTRSLVLTLVFDASLIRPKQLPQYISKVEFGGKVTTRVTMDLAGMLSNFGTIVSMDDEKIVIAVPINKLQEIQSAVAQLPAQQAVAVEQPIQRSKGVITTR